MRQRWEAFKQALRERFSPRWPDEPDNTTPEQIARWVGEHRHPEGR